MEKKDKITVERVQQVFGGSQIGVEKKPLFCSHCDREFIPEYERLWNEHAPVKVLVAVLEKRRSRIIEAAWPNGRRQWQCHFCGRGVESEK